MSGGLPISVVRLKSRLRPPFGSIEEARSGRNKRRGSAAHPPRVSRAARLRRLRQRWPESRRARHSRHRAGLPDLRAEARPPGRSAPLRSQPRPGRPRADRRPRPELAPAPSPGRLDGQRGEARAADRRCARARPAVQRANAAAAPAAGDLRALLQHVRPLPGRHAHEAGGRVVLRRRQAFRPFAARSRRTIAGILATFALFSTLTSNVSLNAAHTIGAEDDRSISRLIVIEVVLGALGLLTSLLLAFGLIAATRRQTAHFRSLVTSSTDLVLVFGDGGCRYASESVANMLGYPEEDLLGEGFERFVHDDDRLLVCAAYEHGEPHEIVFRVANEFREWRHLEAHVTDLRGDRQIRGIVLNARDITERLRLEQELTHQAFHDGLTGLPNRALFRDRLHPATAPSG